MTNSDLSASAWQHLYDIDNLLRQPLSWTGRLEKVNDILMNMLDVDAVWLFTVKPFPTACGLVCTPLPMSPDARTQIMDENSPDFGGYLSAKTPFFIEPDSLTNKQLFSELGDVLFSTFHLIAFAVVPITTNGDILGAFILGSYEQVGRSQYEDMQKQLAHLGEHLGTAFTGALPVNGSSQISDAEPV